MSHGVFRPRLGAVHLLILPLAHQWFLTLKR